MTRVQTIYIVPALTDQAGQCRIVSREGKFVGSARDSYRSAPDLWKEIGLMNSRGTVVCLDAEKAVFDDLKSSEPLMAGSEFQFP